MRLNPSYISRILKLDISKSYSRTNSEREDKISLIPRRYVGQFFPEKRGGFPDVDNQTSQKPRSTIDILAPIEMEGRSNFRLPGPFSLDYQDCRIDSWKTLYTDLWRGTQRPNSRNFRPFVSSASYRNKKYASSPSYRGEGGGDNRFLLEPIRDR